MIVFRKIRFKNFQSYGNVFTELRLDEHQLTAISGKNGAGKTTINSALIFCLYGKTHTGVNKARLVNSINKKDLLVEVEFETNGHSYLVRRGIKPTVFEIYEDGRLIPQSANVNDYQDDFERRILRIDMKNFTQMIVLGTVSFVPFMQLSAGDRRCVIENLLDIAVFSTMNQLLKLKTSAQDKLIESNRYEYQNIVAQVRSEKTVLDTVRRTINTNLEKIRAEIDEKTKKISSLEAEITELKSRLEKFSGVDEKRTTVEQKIVELQKKQGVVASELRRLEKEHRFISSTDTCPYCHQNISEEYRAELEQKIEQERTTAEQKIEELGTAFETLTTAQTKLIKLLERRTEINQSITERYSAINVIEGELRRLNRELTETTDENEIQAHQREIIRLAGEAKALLEEKNGLRFEREIMEKTAELLTDRGIKTAIINRFIPLINKMVNYYLTEMDFFLNFELDENFKETIRARYRDEFTYQNLSQGEKRRLDMALLFTWRYIATVKNSNATNLLFVDEVLDSSLDEAGIDALLALFKTIPQSNVFVITHREALDSAMFDNVLTVTKRGQFSVIS